MMEEHELEPISDERLAKMNARIAWRQRLHEELTPTDNSQWWQMVIDNKDLLAEILRLRAERADLLAHLRPEALLDLSLLDVPCDCADDSREHAPDCPRGLLYYLTTLAERLEREAAQ